MAIVYNLINVNLPLSPQQRKHFKALDLYFFSWTNPGKFDFYFCAQFFYPRSGFNHLILNGFERGVFKFGTFEQLLLHGV